MISLDINDQSSQNRRAFLGHCISALAGITIVGVGAPILEGCEIAETFGSTPTTDDGVKVDVSSLDTDATGVITRLNGPDGFPVIVVRQSATTYVALSSRCTHEGCAVNAPNNGIILCLCHGSEFDLDGKNLAGPAPAPLTRYTTTFNAAENTVTIRF